MTTVIGAGNATLTFGGAANQVAINNTDAAASVNVKINGDPVGFTVEFGGKRGWRVRLYTVQLTGTGTWEVTTT